MKDAKYLEITFTYVNLKRFDVFAGKTCKIFFKKLHLVTYKVSTLIPHEILCQLFSYLVFIWLKEKISVLTL